MTKLHVEDTGKQVDGPSRHAAGEVTGGTGIQPTASSARDGVLGSVDRAASVQRAKGLEVVCRNGQHVGTIEEVEGTVMRVRSSGPASESTIRSIPTTLIHFIDHRVVLKVPSAHITDRDPVG